MANCSDWSRLRDLDYDKICPSLYFVVCELLLKILKELTELGAKFYTCRVHWQDAGFIGKKPGSLARTCNVATDRLVYQDVCGLSATEPCPKAQIWGSIKQGRLVCLWDQTGPT